MKSSTQILPRRRFGRGAAVAILAVAGVMATAVSASAGTTDSPPPDRVIVVDGPMPTAEPPASLRSAADGVSEWTSEALPVPSEYQPEPGQTVTIRYNDGVVSYTGVVEEKPATAKVAPLGALACTHTTSVGNPSLISSPLRVNSALSFSISSGCAGYGQATGHLDWQWLGFGVEKASATSSLIGPGTASNWNVRWTCINANSTNWRGWISSADTAPQYTGWVSRGCGG